MVVRAERGLQVGVLGDSGWFCSVRGAADLEVEVAPPQATLTEQGALDDRQRTQRRQIAERQLTFVLGEEHAARGLWGSRSRPARM